MKKAEAILQLAKEWKKSGIKTGDMVLVHSRASRILRTLKKSGVDIDPKDIVESFVQAVGKTGTVLFPTFNFEFNNGVPFDIDITPSHMGAITEAARKLEGAIRTGHPVYSFAVIGRNANIFQGVENYSGYGKDSPFAILHRNRGKIAILDLPDQHSMTFYHYVEESLQVSYRFLKKFTGRYKGVSRKEEIREFAIYVRNIEQGVLTYVNPMGEILWDQGLYTGNKPLEGNGLRVADAEKVFNAVAHVIRSGKAQDTLYKINLELK